MSWGWIASSALFGVFLIGVIAFGCLMFAITFRE